MRAPASMTAGQINRELDALDARESALLDALIAAGRGHELPSETRKLSDPLALRYAALSDRRWDLRCEVEVRYGPGAPHRLPPRFGRRSS